MISLGCFVGVNELLLGIKYPDMNLIAVDIDSESIEIAKSGVWALDNIRPSGFGISRDDETLQKMYDRFCPGEYFTIDFKESTLKLLKDVPNVTFEKMNALNTRFKDGYFDMVIMHMLGGESCFPYDESYVLLGKETKRILKSDGLFWNEAGLFKKIESNDQFYRILKLKNQADYVIDERATPINYLFPGPM